MKTYTVLSTIQHDGQRYEAGASIEVDDQSAAALLASGDISGPLDTPAKAKK